MALPVRGYGGSFGVGEESTWGTEVARAVWLRANTVGVQRKVVTEMVPDLGSHGSLSTNDKSSFIGREDIGGPLVWPMAYDDGTLTMLRHMFGTVADAGAGPDSWTHTYKNTSLAANQGLTLSLIYGTHASLSTGREVYGAKIGSWEISGEAGKQIMCSADVVARSASAIQAAESPTYGTPTYILASQLSTLFTANSVTEGVQKFSLRVNRNFEIQHELGSLFISEPIDGRMSVELDLEMLWQKATPHTNYEAGTPFDYTFGFSSSTLSAAFTVHNGKIIECDTPVSSAEGVRQSLKIKGFSDAGSGDQGVGLVITNSDQLYTAN
jgi:hypothetical protein